MRIYPHIVYYDGTEKYTGGAPIAKGYHAREETKNGNFITPLNEWFLNK